MARISCFLVIVLAFVASMVAKGMEEMGFVCNGSKNNKASAACGPFTGRGENEPSAECCTMYKAFIEMAKTGEESKQLCSCVQRNTRDFSAIVKNVDALWGICGMPFLYSADPKFNCNTVN